jgi:hypothetical protein
MGAGCVTMFCTSQKARKIVVRLGSIVDYVADTNTMDQSFILKPFENKVAQT